VSKECAKIIGETLKENRLAVEICNLAHDIPDVADFKILKKEEIVNEIREINKY
jgi:hypothetical protein